MQIITTPAATDLNRDAGVRAYEGMSFTPEKRADGDIAEYLRIMAGVTAELEAIAVTEAQQAQAVTELEAFRLKYVQWQGTLWASKSRTMSPMITGPARFPVDRNRKAMDAEMNKVKAFLAWFEKAQAAMKRRVAAAGAPPRTDIPENQTVTIAGVDIVTNYEIERIQIVFPGKPDPETIGALKGAGWNWSPSNKAWQRKITDNSMRSAKRIVTPSRGEESNAQV